MDEIQKELIKAGRKDLAQKYYEKTAAPKALKIMKDLKRILKDVEETFESASMTNPQVKLVEKFLKDYNRL